jgi:hypothetical protein
MSNRVIIAKDADRTTITLKSQIPAYAKYLMVIAGIVLVVFSICLFTTLLANQQEFSILPFLIFAFYLVLAFFIGRNIIVRAVSFEELQLEEDKICLINHNVINKVKQDFKIDKIEHVAYIGYQKWTEHPIGPTNVDFTGLAEREKLVGFLNDQGNIQIDYNSNRFRFAKNIPSWDVEKIFEALIKKYGDKIYIKPIDDYENQ